MDPLSNVDNTYMLYIGAGAVILYAAFVMLLVLDVFDDWWYRLKQKLMNKNKDH